MLTTIDVSGMTCSHCVRVVDSAVRSHPGISEVSVYLEDGLAEIEHDEKQVSPAALANAIEEHGYEASLRA